MTNNEIISAFVDHEPVDPKLLAEALAEAEGRQCLIELLTLDALVAETEEDPQFVSAAREVGRPPGIAAQRPAHRRWLLAAAAVVVVGAGTFAAGLQTGRTDAGTPSAVEVRPPEPHRVIELRDGIEWRATSGGL
jgi:hypothetical protein